MSLESDWQELVDLTGGEDEAWEAYHEYADDPDDCNTKDVDYYEY